MARKMVEITVKFIAEIEEDEAIHDINVELDSRLNDVMSSDFVKIGEWLQYETVKVVEIPD